MSKIKKILQTITFGIAFSSSSQLNQEEFQYPPTLKEYSQKAEKSQQQTPKINIESSFEGFRSYFTKLENDKIFHPLNKEQLNALKQIMNEIEKTPEKNLSQSQKDLRMYFNRYIYRLETPILLSTINSNILKGTQPPEKFQQLSLNTLVTRIPNHFHVNKNKDDIITSVTFYPNERDSDLNRFIISHLSNPKKLSNNQISSIHPSYYHFLVALLLQENSFGSEKESSAKAQGKFQIKPNTQNFVKRWFGLKKASLEELGFLHLFQLAQLFNIDVSKQPTPEEIILLAYTYHQGPNSYHHIYNLDNTILERLQNYQFNILLVMQHPELFEISQEIRT